MGFKEDLEMAYTAVSWGCELRAEVIWTWEFWVLFKYGSELSIQA